MSMSMTEQRDERRLPDGTVIFRQGDAGHEMFVIAEGRVRLTLGGGGHEKEVAVLGPGEFFGELSLLDDAPRSATAQTVGNTTLLAISRDVFAMMVQDDLDIVFRMMNIQGRRLSRANQPIEELGERLGRIRVIGHCLQHMLSTAGGMPCELDLDDVAQRLALTPGAVQAAVEDLVRDGIGALQDRRWVVADRGQMVRLVDAICSHAGPPMQ